MIVHSKFSALKISKLAVVSMNIINSIRLHFLKYNGSVELVFSTSSFLSKQANLYGDNGSIIIYTFITGCLYSFAKAVLYLSVMTEV